MKVSKRLGRVQATRVAYLQALKDVQSGTRILYVICAEGKANKNITIANLVRAQASHTMLAHRSLAAAAAHAC